MFHPSEEQLSIINNPLGSISVIACAGSGKTFTAIHRLAAMRKLMGSHRGRIALLSFSNIAVNTFRNGYQNLSKTFESGSGKERVEIDTLDGFFTRNVLHPHAYRTMEANRAAFLVLGSEPFLKAFQFTPKTYPMSILNMRVGYREDQIFFYYYENGKVEELNFDYAKKIVSSLGRSAAYTHELGRYWCYRTLKEQPAILRAFVRRYPYIVIDEAQDISTLHQAILELLINAGAKISLIGDPNQGIYEFNGADGKFLDQFEMLPNVEKFELTRNYRSVPLIVSLANKLANRLDLPDRPSPEKVSGPYFISYKLNERDKLIEAFQTKVEEAGLSIENSAVLCRGRDQVEKLTGSHQDIGQGVVKGFAQAAISRDKNKDFHGAYIKVAYSIFSLLEDPPKDFIKWLTQPARYPDARPIHRLIWSFTRNSETGLPSTSLLADVEWQPLLLKRTKSLLSEIESWTNIKSVDNLGRKLSKTDLLNSPLVAMENLAINHNKSRIRIDTVHQAKGESLDAVLYLATKDQVLELLGGVNTETGRIGYVAATRAKNLLWLGVPSNALNDLIPSLVASGFQEVVHT